MTTRRERILTALDEYGNEIPKHYSTLRCMVADAIEAAFSREDEAPPPLAIDLKHLPIRSHGSTWCREDEQDWPCETQQLLNTIRSLRRKIAAMELLLSQRHGEPSA